MEKVLLAYDGSECAQRALDYVLGLATRQSNLAVDVITVEQEPRLYGEIAVYVQKETIEKALLEAGKAVAAAAGAKLAAAGVSHKEEVLIGEPAQVIAQRAEALGSSQIVMGTRGMGGLGNLLLGSVATKVLHQTHVPVTLIR